MYIGNMKYDTIYRFANWILTSKIEKWYVFETNEYSWYLSSIRALSRIREIELEFTTIDRSKFFPRELNWSRSRQNKIHEKRPRVSWERRKIENYKNSPLVRHSKDSLSEKW